MDVRPARSAEPVPHRLGAVPAPGVAAGGAGVAERARGAGRVSKGAREALPGVRIRPARQPRALPRVRRRQSLRQQTREHRMSDRNTTKIAIVGAGSVGATIAYACLIRGVAKHVALFDTNRAKVDA